MARTVADLRLLFETMAGSDPSDALSVNPQAASPSRSSLKGIRVGLVEAPQFSKATRETEAAVKKAAQLLNDQGFVVEIFRLQTAERLLDLWWFFFGEVIGELLGKLVSGKESRLSPIFSEYLDAARRLAPITMEEFVANCAARDLERGRVLKAMEHVPFLLAPVCVAPAFRHGEGGWRTNQGYRTTMQHSQWLNLTGMPAVTIPMAKSIDGLPIGIQLVGRPFEDELVIAIAKQLEDARGAWEAPPIA
jgi:Asp-tRNA(Asn)/Glu-tRNA(Gln) amidotransferase A subunit family amidase